MQLTATLSISDCQMIINRISLRSKIYHFKKPPITVFEWWLLAFFICCSAIYYIQWCISWYWL